MMSFSLLLLNTVIHEAFAHVMLIKILNLTLVDLEHDEIVKYRFAFLIDKHLDSALVVRQLLAGGGLEQALMQAFDLLHVIADAHLCSTLSMDEFLNLSSVLTNQNC